MAASPTTLVDLSSAMHTAPVLPVAWLIVVPVLLPLVAGALLLAFRHRLARRFGSGRGPAGLIAAGVLALTVLAAAGLLLAVVVVSVGYLFRQGTAGPDSYLFGGERLPESQLIRIEAAIAQAGLNDSVREGNRIRVPAGQQAKYLAAVADADALPQNFDTILENAIDRGSPWETAAAQREREHEVVAGLA